MHRILNAWLLARVGGSPIAAGAVFGSRFADQVHDIAQRAQQEGRETLVVELRGDTVVAHSIDADVIHRHGL